MEEAEYRTIVNESLQQIERAFREVDPDVAECELSLGSLTIRFADDTRCILSSQPSVRQLWLAVSSKGLAFHFNYDPKIKQWVDDQQGQVEVGAYLRSYLREKTGLEIKF